MCGGFSHRHLCLHGSWGRNGAYSLSDGLCRLFATSGTGDKSCVFYPYRNNKPCASHEKQACGMEKSRSRSFVGNGCCYYISMACKQDRAKPAFKSFWYFPYPNGTERVIFQGRKAQVQKGLKNAVSSHYCLLPLTPQGLYRSRYKCRRCISGTDPDQVHKDHSQGEAL